MVKKNTLKKHISYVANLTKDEKILVRLKGILYGSWKNFHDDLSDRLTEVGPKGVTKIKSDMPIIKKLMIYESKYGVNLFDILTELERDKPGYLSHREFSRIYH